MHAHDRLGVRLAERAAGERAVLRVAEHRPPADRAGGADHAVARPLRFDSRRGSTVERITCSEPGIAEQLEPCQRRG